MSTRLTAPKLKRRRSRAELAYRANRGSLKTQSKKINEPFPDAIKATNRGELTVISREFAH